MISSTSSQNLIPSEPPVSTVSQTSHTWKSTTMKNQESLKRAQKLKAHQRKTLSIQTESTITTELEMETAKFKTFQSKRHYLSIHNSPFVPADLGSWVEQKSWCREAQASAVKRKLTQPKDKLPDTLPAGATSIGTALGGKVLSTNHATTIGYYRTVFSPAALSIATEDPYARPLAQWPEHQEWKFEGSDRIATGFGRMLPLPRVEEADERVKAWQLEVGVESVRDGAGRVPWRERALKEQYPLDAVRRMEDMGGDEVEIDEGVARGWINDELWDALN